MHAENVAIASGCQKGIVIEISDVKRPSVKSCPETGAGLLTNRLERMLRTQYVVPMATYILVVGVFIVVLLVKYFKKKSRGE